jgi:hypothetical protein
MCDSSEHSMKRRMRMGMYPMHFYMMGDCCSDYESKETAIKRLEALKSHLEDRIRSIDQKIAETQKPEEGEEV